MADTLTPHSFRDRTGRLWHVSLTVGDLDRLRCFAGMDLTIAEPDPTAEPVKMAMVLYALSHPDRFGITTEEFERLLDGSALDAGRAALDAAIERFLPLPKDREGPEHDEHQPQPGDDLLVFCNKLGGYIGVDPRPLTLRELWGMAAGRYSALQVEISLIALLFAGKPFPPNPFISPATEPEKLPERVEIENKLGWELFGKMLSDAKGR